MESKGRKLAALIVDLMIFGPLAYLFLFLNPDMKSLLNPSTTGELIMVALFMLGPALALSFTFIMRGIDNGGGGGFFYYLLLFILAPVGAFFAWGISWSILSRIVSKITAAIITDTAAFIVCLGYIIGISDISDILDMTTEKGLRITAIIFDFLVFGLLACLVFFSKNIETLNQKLLALAPVAILFTFIIRAIRIDIEPKFHGRSHIWVLGAIIAAYPTFALLSDKITVPPSVKFYGIFLAASFVICMLAIYVPLTAPSGGGVYSSSSGYSSGSGYSGGYVPVGSSFDPAAYLSSKGLSLYTYSGTETIRNDSSLTDAQKEAALQHYRVYGD